MRTASLTDWMHSKSFRERLETMLRLFLLGDIVWNRFSLELSQLFDIYASYHKPILVSAFELQNISFIFGFGGVADSGVSVHPIVALDNIRMNVKRRRFNKSVKRFNILVPFGNEKKIDHSAQI